MTHSSSSPVSTAGSSSSATTDPLAAARQTCINKINTLRATKAAPALAAWDIGMCADTQVTADETGGQPHGHFQMCGESGQNECLGQGVAGIEGCLDQMWAEKDQPGCSGCDACADSYNPTCPGCDFYGTTTGNVCGHYANMIARYFSAAGCGFNAHGGWAVIDFH